MDLVLCRDLQARIRLPLEHPHEYRDYLIRAFNDDLPYDNFGRAVDLMDEPR